MKINYKWLQDFVTLGELGVTIEEIGCVLTDLGLNVEEIENLDDNFVLDIEVTTNRSDCLNHLGIAREIAAHYRIPVNSVDVFFSENKKKTTSLSSDIQIDNADLCPRYTGRVITDLKVEESPNWLKSRLESVGQRPINNVVDITNYVMLAIGQPLHAFDYEKLEENRIVVRTVKSGESLNFLDGVQRQLNSSMLAICDAQRPVALAGIMGGQETEVSVETSTIFLESAYFDPGSIRRTAKYLGLTTEASFRFERGADPEMTDKALNYACHLLQEISGGVLAGPILDEYPSPYSKTSIVLRSERISRLAGLSVDQEFIADVLPRLEFGLSPNSKEGVWQVSVPSFRSDVKMEVDLIEEVARHYGYDQIKSTYPVTSGIGKFLSTRNHDRIITRKLAGLGFYEAFNYVFANPSKEAMFWNSSFSMVEISNPLTEEDTHLRISLIPGLLRTLERNLNHGNQDVRLFEFGRVFVPGNGDLQEVQEISKLALVATGLFYQPFWDQFDDQFSFYHLKGVVESLLDSLDQQGTFEAISNVDFLHANVSSRVSIGEKLLGVMGEVAPEIQEAYRFRQSVFVAEFSLSPLYGKPLQEPQYFSFGRFPSVEQDLSFLVDNKLEYAKILNAVEELNISDLQGIKLIDLYQGPTLPQGKASLSIRLTFANSERTLTQDEVNQHTERVFSVLQKKFSVEGRS